MIKLTLDTNCIINLLDYKSESAISVNELSEIVNYAFEGNVNIAITTRVEKDFEEDKDQKRKEELIKRLAMFSAIGSVARFGSTKLDNGDVWGGSEHEVLENELIKIIFPGLNEQDSHYSNKINDIDHLIGHKINNRDIFVTDDKQILKKSEELKNSLNIFVMSPKEVLNYLELQANKIVLVQDFFNKFIEFKELILKIINDNNCNQRRLVEYENLRRWIVMKYPRIKDGLLNFKFRMSAIPAGNQSISGQDDILSLQMFNDRINWMLRERNPLEIINKVSSYRNDYSSYRSERDKKNITFEFLNSLEDCLLGYLGKLEDL